MIERLYLIARLAGTRVAFRSSDVDSVVIVRNVTKVPCTPDHLVGLFALRSRVMTLIDARVVVGAQAVAQGGDGDKAIVVKVAGHAYGIIADAVEDACFLDSEELPIRGRLSPGWRAIAEAMIEHAGETVLVVDPERLVAPPLASAA
jgi:purine-binding chemotaxis protein CheW